MYTATRKRRRRTRIGRRTATETGGRTVTGAEMKENVPLVRRRRAKTKREIGIASLIVRKEMSRFVLGMEFLILVKFIDSSWKNPLGIN